MRAAAEVVLSVSFRTSLLAMQNEGRLSGLALVYSGIFVCWLRLSLRGGGLDGLMADVKMHGHISCMPVRWSEMRMIPTHLRVTIVGGCGSHAHYSGIWQYAGEGWGSSRP